MPKLQISSFGQSLYIQTPRHCATRSFESDALVDSCTLPQQISFTKRHFLLTNFSYCLRMHPRARSSADILASAKAAPQTAHFKNYKNLKARADTGGPKNRGPSAIYAHALCKFPANETRLVSGKVSQDELVTANRAAHPTCSTQVLQIGRIQPTVFTFKPPITPTSYNEHSRKACNCVTEVARDMDSKNEATSGTLSLKLTHIFIASTSLQISFV